MKFSLLLTLFVASILTAAPTGISGKWKVTYAGVTGTAPKTVGSMILDLHTEANGVTGIVGIGVWPGEAPIADANIEGDRITFNATGHLSSTTGIPTCRFDMSIQGDEMLVTMTPIRNAGGPLAPGHTYEYRGTRIE